MIMAIVPGHGHAYHDDSLVIWDELREHGEDERTK